MKFEILCFVAIVLFYFLGTLVFVAFRKDVVWSKNFKPPCGESHPAFSVNISGAKEDENGNYKTEDGVVYFPGMFWKSGGSVFGCPCLLKPCIRKCCSFDDKFDLNSGDPPPCVRSTSSSFNPLRREVFTTISGTKTDLHRKIVEHDHFIILHGDVCIRGVHLLDEFESSNDRNFLMEDGRVIVLGFPLPLDQSQYCLESFLGVDDNIHTLACFAESNQDKNQSEQSGEVIAWAFHVLAGGMLISIAFLLVTFSTYALLPKVRSMHGKCLMGYVASLIIAFGSLSILQFGRNQINTQKSIGLCIGLALIVQYAYLSCLLWLNVMSFDIWRTFRGPPLTRRIRSNSCKGFVIYALYAWGLPLTFTLTTAALEFLFNSSKHFIKPNIGVKESCWFGGGEALWIYFYLPIAIILSLNVLMFSTTLYRIQTRHKDNTQELQSIGDSSYRVERNRLITYLRMFAIMGISWILEPVSYLVGGPKVTWVLTDFCNTLQGVVIFYTSVYQPRLLHEVKQEFRPKPTRRDSSSRTTFRSSVISSSSTVLSSPSETRV